ncbi:TPA: hypothetical protein H1011_00535, partial [archaeon]|nr:hypothetical protein [Candidatus Undinarchaeum marinum]
GDDPDRRYREIEIGDIDGDGKNEIILLKNLKYPTRSPQCPEDDPDSYYFNKLIDYKGVAVVVFGMNDYIKASKESAFPIEGIDSIIRTRYGEWRIYELESEFNGCDLEGEGNEAWGMSKNAIEVIDFDGDGKDEILLFAEQKIFVIEEDANGDLTHYVIDQDAQYHHSGGISKHDFFLLGNINIGKDYEALYIFRNPDITQTDVKIGVTQLIFNEEDGTYESVKTKDMDTWNIPENSWYEDATICDFDHDGWDDELVLIRGEKRSPYIGASTLQPSDFRLQIYEFEQNSDGEIWINSEPLHTTNKLPYRGRWEELVCDDFDGDGWDEVVLIPLGISTEQDVEGTIYVLETENILTLGDDVYNYGIEEIRNKLPWGILEIGDRAWISIAGGNLIGN